MNGRKFLSSAGALMLLATSLPLGIAGPQVQPASASAPASQFPDVAPDTTAFNNLWDRTDSLVATGRVKRSWLWGPQAFWTTRELYVDDPQHTETRLVQYWDKSRMEINDPSGNPNNAFYVTNGLLTVELISGKMQTGNNTFEDRKPSIINIAGDVDDPNAPTYSSFIGKANAGTDHPDSSKMGQKVLTTLARNGSVGREQQRVVPTRDANLDGFKSRDIAMINHVIRMLEQHNASEVSEMSHGRAWRVVGNYERIPYNAIFLSDEGFTDEDRDLTREVFPGYSAYVN